MSHVLGMNCKMYRCATLLSDPANLPADATWIEVPNVRDLTLNLEASEADITSRNNSGWRAIVAALKEGSVETEIVWDTSDANFTALQQAFLNNTEIAIAVMDGDIATVGSQGLVANMTVSSFSRSEPLEEATMASVTLKPSSEQEWYTTAGS